MKRSVIFQLLIGGLTFLTLAGCHSGAMKQKPILSDSAQIALKEIRKDNTFYLTRYIGEAGTETPQYGYADLLGRSCDANTLEWLCRNDSSDRKSTRLNSSHANISYAVFCLKKKK